MSESVCEVFFADVALIVVGPDPGVHDQLAKGVVVEDLQKIVEFVRIIEAEPRLDRYLHVRSGGVGIDVIQKRLKSRCLREESRAFALRADGSGRASEIKVYFLVAHSMKLFRCVDKAVGSAREDLGDKVYSDIVLRVNVLALAGRHRVFLARRNKRRKILVDMPVDPAESIAEYITCNAFKRREINLHIIHAHILSRAAFYADNFTLSPDFLLYP